MAAKKWIIGRDLTALSLYTGVRASDGTITWTLAGSLVGYTDSVTISDDRVLEPIQSVDGLYMHYEKTLMDFSCMVTEILSSVQASVTALVAQTSDFCKVVFTRAGKVYTFLGVISDFHDGISSFGKNTATLTLKPIDTGATPLTYV